MSNAHRERRKHQRFLAKRENAIIFWVILEGQRIPLLDLSLEGFSYVAQTPPATEGPQPFELRLEGIPDKVKGSMEPVNFIPGKPNNIVGCRFVELDAKGRARLHEWLTTHVIACAGVRITAKEAEKIVEGPSLI